MLSLAEALTNFGSLLGLYDDRPTNSFDNTCCCFTFLSKILFLIIDIISSSLDWNVAFKLLKGDFQLIGSASDETEEVGPTEVLIISGIYITMLVISHFLFLRGKWFYLQNDKDWAAFSMTEIVIYAVEDVTTLFMFLVTRGFFDPDGFLDRLNVIISNISGYLVAVILWFRLLSCRRNNDGVKAPCSAYLLPIWFTVQIVLISWMSYRTLFLQKWGSAFDNSSDEDPSFFDFFLPIIAGAWSGIMFFWVLAFLWRWDKCLSWAGEDNRDGGDHNLLGFIAAWTIVFGVTIGGGWALTLTEESEYDWSQSFSEMSGDLQDGQNSTILYFGHTVSWGRAGDRNGYGSSILIGALDPFDIRAGYTGSAGLCDPPCIGDWSVDTIIPGMPFCAYPSVMAGFETNMSTGVSNGFLRKSWRRDYSFDGPPVVFTENQDGSLTNNTNTSYSLISMASAVVSVTAGGSTVYDLTPGVDVTPNPYRFVVGYPYANNSTGGYVQAYQLYQQRYQTGGFVNTAYDMLQIGQDIVFQSDENEEESLEFGDQISMGSSYSSRLAVTSVKRDGSKAISFYDFDDNTDTWNRQSPLLTSTIDNDGFGHSIELNRNGNMLVVGAPKQDKGYAYVYEKDPSSVDWTQVGDAIVPNIASDIYDIKSLVHFGFSVTINEGGNRIAASGETHNSTLVFVFEKKSDNAAWIQVGTPILGEPGSYDAGYRDSLSMNHDGKFIAIGSVGEGPSAGLGRVRIFKYTKNI